METPKNLLKATKRRHSEAFKRKLIKLTEQACASVAAIALAYGAVSELCPSKANSSRPA